MDVGDHLKLAEVAHRLGISEKTVRRYVKRGTLPSIFVGNAYRVHPDDLDAYIERSRDVAEGGADDPKAGAPSRASSKQDEATARRLQGIADIVGYYRGRWEEELGDAGRYPTRRGPEVYFAALGLAELANTEIRRTPRGEARTERARTAALDARSSLLAFGRQVRAGMDKQTQDEGSAEAAEHRRHLRVLEGGLRDSA